MAKEDDDGSKAHSDGSQSPSPDGQKTSPNTKGSSRPKRKKARRACLACQRAHLTCGDERPCERCIKRGLQDACHDGMRKKAKYLHDAPNEALMPGAQEAFLQTHAGKDDSPVEEATQSLEADETFDSNGHSAYDERRQSVYHNVPSIIQDESSFVSYASQKTTLSPNINPSQLSPARDRAGIVSSPSQPAPNNGPGYDTAFFDPSDSVFFNFDLASMNFGNHYGALEFGILGHLSSGANENGMMSRPNTNTQHTTTTAFDESLASANYLHDIVDGSNLTLNPNGSLPDWQNNPGGHGLQMNSWNTNHNNADISIRRESNAEPNAYAIGAVSSHSGASPASNGTDGMSVYERGHAEPILFASPQRISFDPNSILPQIIQPQRARENGPSEVIAKKLGNLLPTTNAARKRRRDPSTVYSAVTKPYPYTLGFHALTAVLQRRFSSPKRLLIAQALARIRPSFISCTRTLMDDDLIFMEKCFQRQLIEYEDFVGACGTPTIVCRRTGEVAYAGKEFSLLTGWNKDVLLGKAPNLNVNGHNPSGSLTGGSASRTGGNTPRVPVDAYRADGTTGTSLPARPQAVFLAELLDDGSVIQFYEDFAKLAFADSKGSVWSPCKLLKYKTKDDLILKGNATDAGNDAIKSDEVMKRDKRRSSTKGRANEDADDGEGLGVELFRERSKVDCMYCWTIRRDVFDIPMMIVINFLPVI